MHHQIGRSRDTARRAIQIGAVAAAALVVGSLVAGASVLPGPVATPPAVARCGVQALGTLGGRFGNAVAVNRQGVAVGTADDASGVAHPVMWSGTTPQRLATGLSGSLPLAVNAVGQVIGTGVDAKAGGPRGWTWVQGHITFLQVRGHRVAWPEAINDHGVIVGVLSPDESVADEAEMAAEDENEWAAIWPSPSSEPVVLSPLRGDQGAHAFAVDGKGRVGGISQGDTTTPVVWDAAGQPHALPTLGGGYGIVRGLSDSGVAVGDAVRADGADHAVIWDAAGRITDLGLPEGARSAKANAVLPDGVTFGTAELPVPGGWRVQAVRWAAPGAVQVLPSPAGSAANAADATTVAGYRADGAGGRHPALWRCGR
jgi:uncharacterized membrane protein